MNAESACWLRVSGSNAWDSSPLKGMSCTRARQRADRIEGGGIIQVTLKLLGDCEFKCNR